jgi:hypothetical protein
LGLIDEGAGESTDRAHLVAAADVLVAAQVVADGDGGAQVAADNGNDC